MQPKTSGPAWTLPFPRWRGEALTAKRIYFWAEQGLGDVVMFASMLPYVLAQKPARVALGTFPKMLPLFARSFPDIAVEPIEEAGRHALAPALLEAFPVMQKLGHVPEQLQRDYERAQRDGVFDYASPISALMEYALPNYVPAQHAAYLKADPKLCRRPEGWAVGISWQTSNPEGTARNIPLAEWMPILKTPGCRFFSLQHGAVADEIAVFCAANGVQVEMPAFDPLQDTDRLAARIASMNEVITVDNANAHLAGALGTPTTLMLPNTDNFRWPVQEKGPDTLWYASVKVLRQEVQNNWHNVIARAADALHQARDRL